MANSITRLAATSLPPLSLSSMHRFASSIKHVSDSTNLSRGIPLSHALSLSHRFLAEQVNMLQYLVV